MPLDVFEVARQTYGYIDLVANNAGIADEVNWRKMVDINMVGTSYLNIPRYAMLGPGTKHTMLPKHS